MDLLTIPRHPHDNTLANERGASSGIGDNVGRARPQRLNIGLYGGLANNLYLMARALAGFDHKVTFIRERDIAHAMSQPVWEDRELSLQFEELPRTSDYSAAQWTDLEQRLHWEPPDWLWDPQDKTCFGAEYQQLQKMRLGFSESDAAILRKMRSCDLLVTTGIKPTVLAWKSGVPYIIQPHGGDMMIASGRLRMGAPNNWLTAFFGSPWERAARVAFNGALAIGVHNKHLDQVRAHGKRVYPIQWPRLKTELQELATYTETQPPLSHGDRQRLRTELSATLGAELPTDRWLVFVPSRVDYFWKGQDRLLKAMRNDLVREKFAFLFAGWGANFSELKAACDDLGSSALFLDRVLSKQILYKAMAASDLVIDNFVSGHYGTTGAEAMGRGTPLLMWCDPCQYGGEDQIPPVLQARTPEEVEQTLTDCCSGRIDLDERRAEAFQWALAHHSSSAVEACIRQIVGRDTNNHGKA